jgi:hypothetical protein
LIKGFRRSLSKIGNLYLLIMAAELCHWWSCVGASSLPLTSDSSPFCSVSGVLDISRFLSPFTVADDFCFYFSLTSNQTCLGDQGTKVLPFWSIRGLLLYMRKWFQSCISYHQVLITTCISHYGGSSCRSPVPYPGIFKSHMMEFKKHRCWEICTFIMLGIPGIINFYFSLHTAFNNFLTFHLSFSYSHYDCHFLTCALAKVKYFMYLLEKFFSFLLRASHLLVSHSVLFHKPSPFYAFFWIGNCSFT